MSDQTIEPDIAEAVDHVANRFGVRGLEDMIARAQQKLLEARAALEQLGEESAP